MFPTRGFAEWHLGVSVLFLQCLLLLFYVIWVFLVRRVQHFALHGNLCLLGLCSCLWWHPFPDLRVASIEGFGREVYLVMLEEVRDPGTVRYIEMSGAWIPVPGTLHIENDNSRLIHVGSQFRPPPVPPPPPPPDVRIIIVEHEEENEEAPLLALPAL